MLSSSFTSFYLYFNTNNTNIVERVSFTSFYLYLNTNNTNTVEYVSLLLFTCILILTPLTVFLLPSFYLFIYILILILLLLTCFSISLLQSNYFLFFFTFYVSIYYITKCIFLYLLKWIVKFMEYCKVTMYYDSKLWKVT